MANYRLSAAAEDDLDRLYVYGVLNFGPEQTESYIVLVAGQRAG